MFTIIGKGVMKVLNFYGDLTPRQAKGVILGLLGLCILATGRIAVPCPLDSAFAASLRGALTMGAGIGFLTAVYCVMKEA